MKIAIYSGNIPSTTFIENLIEGLSENGFTIYLFGKERKEIKYNSNIIKFPTPVSNIKLILFVIKEFFMLLLKYPGLFNKVILIIYNKKETRGKSFFKEAGVLLPILNHQPDIFHIQWAKTVEQYPELFSLMKSKIALSLRGAHINYSPLSDINLSKAYKKYFPIISGFHAVSVAIGKEATKYGADENKIKVIYSSVRNELIEYKPILNRTDSLPEIISIGRFHWKKGYHYALDALKNLADEGIKINYTIVAQGEIPEEIIFLIDEYKLKDNVTIIQGLPYSELIEKLKLSHLLLLPSVEEGIANVVLESMAAGVPVITTDCGGMREVINDRVNGYVVKVRDYKEIALKIKEFLNSNIEVKENIVIKAKDKIIKQFTKEKQINDFSLFYSSLNC